MKNVHLSYTGNIKKVKTAVEKANEILATEEFYNLIRCYKNVESNSFSPEIISRLMKDSGHQIVVKVSWFAPITLGKPGRIIISGWDFSNNLGAGVNTLVYETVQSLDCLYGISSNKKEIQSSINHTASWLIGAIAETMVVK